MDNKDLTTDLNRTDINNPNDIYKKNSKLNENLDFKNLSSFLYLLGGILLILGILVLIINIVINYQSAWIYLSMGIILSIILYFLYWYLKKRVKVDVAYILLLASYLANYISVTYLTQLAYVNGYSSSMRNSFFFFMLAVAGLFYYQTPLIIGFSSFYFAISIYNLVSPGAVSYLNNVILILGLLYIFISNFLDKKFTKDYSSWILLAGSYLYFYGLYSIFGLNNINGVIFLILITLLVAYGYYKNRIVPIVFGFIGDFIYMATLLYTSYTNLLYLMLIVVLLGIILILSSFVIKKYSLLSFNKEDRGSVFM